MLHFLLDHFVFCMFQTQSKKQCASQDALLQNQAFTFRLRKKKKNNNQGMRAGSAPRKVREDSTKHSTSIATTGEPLRQRRLWRIHGNHQSCSENLFSTYNPVTRLSLWTTQPEEMHDLTLMHESRFISVRSRSDVC